MTTPESPNIIKINLLDGLSIEGQRDWTYVIAFGQSTRGWHVSEFIKRQLLKAGVHEHQIEFKPLAGFMLESELGSIGMLTGSRRLFLCEAPYEMKASLRRYISENNGFILLFVGDEHRDQAKPNELLIAERILGDLKTVSMEQLFHSWAMVQRALDEAAPFCSFREGKKVSRVFITLCNCIGVDIHLLRAEMVKRRIDALVFQTSPGVVRVEFLARSQKLKVHVLNDFDLREQKDRQRILALFQPPKE